MLIAQMPFEKHFSAETWRLMMEDIQQLCVAALRPEFDMDAYTPREEWPSVAGLVQ